MHAELMDFNVHLQQTLCKRDGFIERLKSELEDLRGPSDELAEDAGCSVSVWIPSAFLTGKVIVWKLNCFRELAFRWTCEICWLFRYRIGRAPRLPGISTSRLGRMEHLPEICPILFPAYRFEKAGSCYNNFRFPPEKEHWQKGTKH